MTGQCRKPAKLPQGQREAELCKNTFADAFTGGRGVFIVGERAVAVGQCPLPLLSALTGWNRL